MKNYLWKVWLRPNHLTKEEVNDYVAEVSTVGKTLHNADLARLVVAEGSEFKLETLVDLFELHDRLRLDMLLKGYRVQTGICNAAPRVAGRCTVSTPSLTGLSTASPSTSAQPPMPSPASTR